MFITCKFRPDDKRAYTYTWDGEPLAKGDMVKVADARSDGWKAVIVEDVDVPEPPFACKPILGRYEPDEVLEAPANETIGALTSGADPLSDPVAF